MSENTSLKTKQFLQSADYIERYVIGAYGRWHPYDFRISFYNLEASTEKLDYPPDIKKPDTIIVNNVTIISPPKPTKELAWWLMKHVLEFEEKNEEIPFGELPLKNAISVLKKLKKYDIKKLEEQLKDLKEKEKKEIEKTEIERRKEIAKKKVARKTKTSKKKSR